ncbi:MAG: hypothetical protein GX230_04355 [Lentisphaerae bacterium]|nr:hypothetical protein [Lentisphaerota bacterium]
MSEEQHLQALLDKIHSEGIAQAEAKAAEIIANAETRAKEIVALAERAAAEHRQSAERDANAFEQRGNDAVQQASRDIILSVAQAVQQQLESLLLAANRESLATPDTLSSLAQNAVRTYLSSGQKELDLYLSNNAVAVAEALRNSLAAQAAQGVNITLDQNTGSGFRVRLDNGRVEHDFTAEAITTAIASRVRPQLAALLHK